MRDVSDVEEVACSSCISRAAVHSDEIKGQWTVDSGCMGMEEEEEEEESMSG